MVDAGGVASIPGSSPRVRGTPTLPILPNAPPRIIPACAGNTPSRRRTGGSPRDHPRVCGEHTIQQTSAVRHRESSPRVRGTRQSSPHGYRLTGIIPACAGNTRRSRIRRKDSRDHPRVCREHVMDVGDSTVEPGSSPRVRGTLPARHQSKGGKRDHPRVCGEHRIAQAVIGTILGSSPRVRGTPWYFLTNVAFRRIIPACAGNTPVFSFSRRTPRDHPRVCGEHIHQWSCALCLTGSSPRVRGTRALSCARVPRPGIIPACAGNTRPCGPRCCSPRDHPRVCGEHEPVGMSYIECLGSSPRVRGTQMMGGDLRSADGIIPACAGNTCRTRSPRQCARDHPRVCGEH